MHILLPIDSQGQSTCHDRQPSWSLLSPHLSLCFLKPESCHLLLYVHRPVIWSVSWVRSDSVEVQNNWRRDYTSGTKMSTELLNSHFHLSQSYNDDHLGIQHNWKVEKDKNRGFWTKQTCFLAICHQSCVFYNSKNVCLLSCFPLRATRSCVWSRARLTSKYEYRYIRLCHMLSNKVEPYGSPIELCVNSFCHSKENKMHIISRSECVLQSHI